MHSGYWAAGVALVTAVTAGISAPEEPADSERFTSVSRREKLAALLAETPDDPFLQYALAMQFASDGDDGEAIRRLDTLLEQQDDYVPAYFQLGQLLARLSQDDRARHVLVRGIAQARRAGDDHAEEEMRGFLESLPG